MERNEEHLRNRENHASVYGQQCTQSASPQALSTSAEVVPRAVWIVFPPVNCPYRARLLYHYATKKLMDK